VKHLLLVAYYFPPAGGVLVRRVLRFVRHLPAHGFRCTVLSADRPYDPFHPDDPTGVDAIPEGLHVLRPPARSGLERALVHAFRGLQAARGAPRVTPASGTATGPEGGRARRLLNETLTHPDPKRPWVRGAADAALAAAPRDPFDLVLASGYPWSGFLVADRVARALAIPAVLDFRDAWTLNPRELWSGPRCRRLEAELVSRAAALTLATDWIRDRMRDRHSGVSPERFVTVTNGYDESERPAPDPALREPGRLVVAYTGTFNDALPPSRFDHSPYHLLEAVKRLAPSDRAALRVRLVGRVGPAHRAYVAREGLADVVEIVGAVPHARALQHQSAADLLLLVVGDAPSAGAILTGKLVEYAGARRPVLALAPDCEASRVVRRHGIGWVEAPEDLAAIAARLTALVADWRAGRLPAQTAAVPELAAEAQVARLAEVLGRALAARRA
jgi:glycosyltransferase involved in cell wall biosynthesis